MLNTNDSETIASISILKRIVREGKRPIVLWIGAGASLWSGYPSWKQVARKFRRTFASEVAGFDDASANAALSSGDYPIVFEICKKADETKYHNLLHQTFVADGSDHPLYDRFIEKAKAVVPKLIVTSNVDLSLEQNLSCIDVIERSDLERLGDSIIGAKDFVAKLHGSISSISSTVFASSEYSELISDKSFIASLQNLFTNASIIFLGYGVRDQYVLNLINAEHSLKTLFGSGPHFIVTSSLEPRSDSLKRIAYRPTHAADHRAALYVLDFVKQAQATSDVTPVLPPNTSTSRSAIYISLFLPPGKYQSSQLVTFGTPENPKMGELSIGTGFTQAEMPLVSRAFHDLLVGLLCFDDVYLPLDAIPRLNQSANPIFKALIDDGSIRFVHTSHDVGFINLPESLLGDIGSFSTREPGSDESVKVETILRKWLAPVVGREAGFESDFAQIKKLVTTVDVESMNSIPQLTRDALVMPRVAELIGLSDAVVPSTIPQWLKFPVLRLAHLITTSVICTSIGAQSVRVPFGGTALIDATFGLQTATSTADFPASYVLTGKLSANLAGAVQADLGILLRVLKFRNTSEGQNLRSEVRDSLKIEIGSEFEAAIDAGLRRTISASVLDSARDRLSQLATSDGSRIVTPVVWTDTGSTETAMKLWRSQSRQNLMEVMRKSGLTKNSDCLCGSGEAIKDCCLHALKIS